MSLTAGLISGFDDARKSYRDAELKKAAGDQDREFSILSALAQHVDPELAAMGAAGLLQLAGGGAPKSRKGLSGFLGEVDKSTYMPQLKALFGTGAGPSAAPATPGSAAQPDTALIEPEAQRVGAGVTPPTFGGTVTAGSPPVGGVTPPTMGATAAEAGPDVGGDVGPPQLGVPGLGMPPPGPPPPETSQGRMRRLFPSAGDIAADTTFKNLQARLQGILGAIQGAGGNQQDMLNATLGIAGAPRRASTSKPLNAEFRTADGQEMSGTVIFDPATRTAEVDGQPVTILKMLPTNSPQPLRVNVKGPDGNITATFRDRNNPNAAPIAEIPTGMPPPAGPAPYSGTVTTDEGVFRLPRGGGDGVKIGDAPPRAGELSPEQQEATSWLTDVNAEVKAKLNAFNSSRPGMPKSTSLSVTEQNALVQKVSRGRYKTIGELTAATKRQAGAGGAKSDSPRDRANRVRQRLEGQDPSTVKGSGLPPGFD